MLARDLIAAYGLLDAPGVRELAPRVATEAELRLVHTPAYIDAVLQAGSGVPGDWRQYGLGTGDNPIFAGMHHAASHVTGATLVAAASVLSGAAEHAFSPAGGMHHAMPGSASGFCIYDDPAVAIAWLLAEGVGRIAYIDVDVHHGDGVQATFYDDPRVLTISLHESGRFLFPGTGEVSESGGPAAAGTKVNVPLPPGTGGEAWLRAFNAVVPPLVRAWRPDVLVTQLGCDTHATDPLAHLELHTSTYGAVARVLHALAHDAAGGRWLATGGGGYQWAEVVPRAWTAYFAEMCGVPLGAALPATFVAHADALAGHPTPATLIEDEPPATQPELAAVDTVVTAVQERIFPAHGL